MAMSDYSLSDIATVTEGGNGGGGRGGWGDGWWIILLFILLGYGGRGWGNGQQGAGSAGGDMLYPWLNQAQNNWEGIAEIQQAICNGFANLETSNNARQIANMQQQFALQSQFADCCCENRLGLANLGADIAREACADRAAISDGIRDILTNQNMSTQRILDQMCQDKIDAKNDEIAQLRQQVINLNLAASQGAQTSRILADNAAQTVALEQYLNPTPVPAYVVQNPNCCQQNNCGCGSF